MLGESFKLVCAEVNHWKANTVKIPKAPKNTIARQLGIAIGRFGLDVSYSSLTH